jgi:hypothetical protein
VLFQGGENRRELKKVESRGDLDVGDHSFGDPGIDGGRGFFFVKMLKSIGAG